jgi:hypothetical protein
VYCVKLLNPLSLYVYEFPLTGTLLDTVVQLPPFDERKMANPLSSPAESAQVK